MVRPRLVPVEELFADPVFSGASLSPDGKRLAYLAPQHGRTQVWVRAVEDEHDRAVCVTHDRRRGIRQYYWTDNPRWLLYQQTRTATRSGTCSESISTTLVSHPST